MGTANIELTKEYIYKFQDIIERKDEKVAKEMMENLHAVDIAEIYSEITIEEAKYLFLLLDKEKAADVLAELEEDDREKFLKILPSKVIAEQFINEMDSDDAADVIGDLPEERQKEVLSHIDDIEHAGDIVDLLHYEEDSAGGLMGKEFVKVNENWTIAQCIQEIGKQAEDVDEVYYVYVVNDDNILKGKLSLKKLLTPPTNTKVKAICNEEIVTVTPNIEGEEVARKMQRYDLVALPVIDDIGRLLGRITVDDVIDFIRDEADRDYQMASGLTDDVESKDNLWHITKARLPWLLIGLFGGVMGAQVMGVFESELTRNAAIAFFIPLIAAMGGNVGIQSSAIVVQSLANKTSDFQSTFQKIMKEFGVALITGLTCAVLLFFYNLLTADSFSLTITVSLALFAVILFASVFGTFVPLTLNKFDIDPAIATGPFITTMNDIVGLLIYFSTGKFITYMFNL